MSGKLFVNRKLKFMQYVGNLYTVYVGGNHKTILVDIEIIEILEAIDNNGITREELARVINQKNIKSNEEKVTEWLINQLLLVETPPKYNWESNTYGISCIGEMEKNAAIDIIKSKRLFRYEYQTLESLRWQKDLPCKRLEEEIAKLIGTQYCLVMNSGTSALECAFSILDIGAQDEVICSTYNYIGSASSMMHNLAKPVLCDINETYMLDPEAVEKAITSKTKAILCTHLQGKMADIIALRNIADKHGVYLVEDCAQAIGVEIEGKKVGAYGDVACFSFHQHKVISAGEGGAIVMNDKKLYEKAIMFSDASRAYIYRDNIYLKPAHNMRMPEINAAILLQQMNYLEGFAIHLRRIYGIFEAKLKKIKGLKLEKIIDFDGCIPQSVYIRCETHDVASQFDFFLKELGITSRVLYCQQEINTNVFLWWPCIMAKTKRDQYKRQYSKTLNLLSKTVSISLGIGVSEVEAEDLCNDVVKYFQ